MMVQTSTRISERRGHLSVPSGLTERRPAATSNASPSSFKFVTVSHPDDIRRRKDTQTEIRRHVMKDIGKQRRRPRGDNKSTSPESTPEALTLDNITHSSPTRSLPPLGSFPISTDLHTFEMIRFGRENDAVYIPFRDIWFELSLSDPGTFYVTLGNATVLWNTVVGDDLHTSREAKKHFSRSLTHLRKRLNDPHENTSTGVVSNILAHICHNMRNADWSSWRVHMDGLSLVGKARGGFFDLPSNTTTLIMQYDLAGAILFDTVPRFPLPLGITQTQPMLLSPQLQEILDSVSDSPNIAPAAAALKYMSLVADTVNMKSFSPSFWKNAIEGINLVGPCIHFLLSMPRLPASLSAREMSNEKDSLLVEMVRLTGLLLMANLKEKFSFFTAERKSLEDTLATVLVTNWNHLDTKFSAIRQWILVTSNVLLANHDSSEHLTKLLRKEASTTHISAVQMVELAKDIIWINIIEAPNEDALIRSIGE